MEELFRMVVIRAPEEREDIERLELLHPQVDLITRPWDEAIKTVPEDRLYLDPKKVPYAEELRTILTATDYARAEALVRHYFGNNITDLVNDDRWSDQRRKLSNGILFVIANNRDDIRLDRLTDLYRAMILIERVALGIPFDIQHFSSASFVLPSAGQPSQAPSPQPFPEGVVEVVIPGVVKVPPPLKCAGVADLLVVRQKLLRYELTDIAHIENVLASEERKHLHRRKVTSEEIFVTETETEKTEQRDQQSTERYELKNEVDQTIQADQEFKAQVTAKVWGASYSVDANASYARKDARTEAMKSATNIAREIVSKSVTTLREKIRQQQTHRLVEEIEVIDEHNFLNTGGNAKNISGVYQWLEKVYEAQVFDYGERTIYDIIVPEPAALLIEAYCRRYRSIGEKRLAEIPDCPVLPPGADAIDYNINSANDYRKLAVKYQALEIEAPPEQFASASVAFAGHAGEEWEWLWTSDKADVKIPPGYQAKKALVSVDYESSPDPSNVVVLVGGQQVTFPQHNGGGLTDTLQLNGQQDQISAGIGALRVGHFAATITIECELTSRALEDWKRKVYVALIKGYQKQMSEYQQALTEAEAQVEAETMAEISSLSPAENRKLIDVEIKRAVIARLQNAYYMPNCIEKDGLGLPRPDLWSTYVWEPTIRFLEQAFEWDKMAYIFYPYFWSRKSEWVSKEWAGKLLYANADPQFADFVKAGAARVQLPVRRTSNASHAFETAVEHFCRTGRVWAGGPLPQIGEDLYLPFYEEQKAQLGSPDNEVPYSDPWEVRVPTTLIKLRQDDRVPVFGNACLFQIGKDNQKDLDQGALPPELRKGIESHGVPLGADNQLKISTEVKDLQWRLFDPANKVQFVIKKGENLNVYLDQVDSSDPNKTETGNGN
jgi:hypothetical protein